MLNLVVNGEVAAQGRYIPELYYNSDMAYPEHGMVQWNCTLKSGKTLYAPTLERLFGLWLKA